MQIRVPQRGDKKTLQDTEQIVEGLEKLLERAKAGKLRGICFAGVEENGDILAGALRVHDCHIHELIGLSSLLNDSLLNSVRS